MQRDFKNQKLIFDRKRHLNWSNHPFDICLNPLIMCKEGCMWVWILHRSGLREGGGNCLKYLKRWWNRKEGKGNKGFKKGAQAGSRGGCIKKGDGGGAGTPLRTMNLYKNSSDSTKFYVKNEKKKSQSMAF